MSATVQLLRWRIYSISMVLCYTLTQQGKGNFMDVITHHAI
jgi:hypothetical protein